MTDKTNTRASTDAGGAVSEAVGWASQWTGQNGETSTGLHLNEKEARDNAEWMSGRWFPLSAVLTPAPQAEGETHPCYGEHQPGCDCVIPEQKAEPTPSYMTRLSSPQPLQQGGEVTRAMIEEAFAPLRSEDDERYGNVVNGTLDEARDAILTLFVSPDLAVEASVPEAGNAVRASGDSTTPDLGDLAGLTDLLDLLECRNIGGHRDGKLLNPNGPAAARALRVLSADRDKAVGLLRRWRSDLPSEALEDLTDAFLSSQTEGS